MSGLFSQGVATAALVDGKTSAVVVPDRVAPSGTELLVAISDRSCSGVLAAAAE